MSYKFQVTSYRLHILLSVFCFLFSVSLFAQKSKPKEPEHKIVFNIKDCKDNQMLLAIHFRDKLMLKDSAYNDGKGSFIFEGSGKYEEGMYSLVSDKKRMMLNFILDGSQHFIYNMDTTGIVRHFSVVGSPENADILRFQQKTAEAQQKMTEWNNKRKDFDSKNMKDSANFYIEKMKNLNAEVEQFISELITQNPTFLFSKLQKSYREIEIPKPPVLADGSIDSSFQAIYYRTHYWDNFDLTDNRFLFLPSYEPKLNNYFQKILWYQEVDTINKYADMMIKKTSPDSLMYRFLMEYLLKEFELSKVIGHDGVFVHLVKNNVLAGKCKWMDEDLVKKYRMRIEDLEPMLIGNKTVELILPDTSQIKWYSSYDMPKKYRILWFYDHTCPTCKKEAKEMKVVYDSLGKIGQLNFDVYAVNKTEDFEHWKKYIRDNGFSWINVGGNQGNVDWIKAYHIVSNPQFYIINQDKVIILNKDISKDMIPQFLKEYEKIEAEKVRQKNKQR